MKWLAGVFERIKQSSFVSAVTGLSALLAAFITLISQWEEISIFCQRLVGPDFTGIGLGMPERTISTKLGLPTYETQTEDGTKVWIFEQKDYSFYVVVSGVAEKMGFVSALDEARSANYSLAGVPLGDLAPECRGTRSQCFDRRGFTLPIEGCFPIRLTENGLESSSLDAEVKDALHEEYWSALGAYVDDNSRMHIICGYGGDSDYSIYSIERGYAFIEECYDEAIGEQDDECFEQHVGDNDRYRLVAVHLGSRASEENHRKSMEAIEAVFEQVGYVNIP